MSKKEFLLVTFLVAFGLVVDFFEEHKREIKVDLRGIVDERIDFDYSRAINALSREDEFSGLKRVVIHNEAGRVTVKAAPVERIKLKTTIYIAEKYSAEKERLIADLSLKSAPTGDELRIENSFPERENFLRRLRIAYELEVPLKTELYVENRFGSISVDDLNGSAELINKFGDLKLNAMSGDVIITLAYGDIEATGLGRTKIEHRYGKAKLKDLQSLSGESKNCKYQIKDVSKYVEWSDAYSNFDLSGCAKLTFRGRYSELNAANITGDVSVENSYQPINLKNIQGNLTISGKYNRIRVEDLTGKNLELSNSYQQVELKKIKVESALINVRYGKVKLTLLSLEKELSASGKYSHWQIFFPPHFTPQVVVRNRFGDFENRSHLQFNFHSEGSENIYESKAQGAKIFLENSYGDVSFDKFSEDEL